MRWTFGAVPMAPRSQRPVAHPCLGSPVAGRATVPGLRPGLTCVSGGERFLVRTAGERITRTFRGQAGFAAAA